MRVSIFQLSSGSPELCEASVIEIGPNDVRSSGPAILKSFVLVELVPHYGSLCAFKVKVWGPPGRATVAVAELSPRRSLDPVVISNVIWSNTGGPSIGITLKDCVNVVLGTAGRTP